MGWCESTAPAHCHVRSSLDGSDFHCLRSFGSLPNLELNALVFLERAIAASLDLGVVDEEILRAIVGGDEAEALVALVTVEPFHSPCAIYLLLSFKMRMYQNIRTTRVARAGQLIENRCGARTISAGRDTSGDRVCDRRYPSGGAATDAT